MLNIEPLKNDLYSSHNSRGNPIYNRGCSKDSSNNKKPSTSSQTATQQQEKSKTNNAVGEPDNTYNVSTYAKKVEEAIKRRLDTSLSSDNDNDTDLDSAFYVGDLGELHRQHLKWKSLLPRIEPFYGKYSIYQKYIIGFYFSFYSSPKLLTYVSMIIIFRLRSSIYIYIYLCVCV